MNFLNLLPQEFRSSIEKARRLGVYRRNEVLAIGLTSIAVIILEGLGVGLMLPLLQYVEHRGDVAALAAQSRLWQYLTLVFSGAGVPVNLLTLSIVLFVLLAARQIFVAARSLSIEGARARAARRLAEKCFIITMNSRGEHIQNIGSGHFSNVVTSQTELAATVIRQVGEVWANLLTLAGYMVIMAYLAFVPMLIASVIGLVILASVGWLVRLARFSSDKVVKERARFSQFLVERINAWRLIKVSNSLPVEINLVQRITASLTAIEIRLSRILNVSTIIVTLGQALMSLLVLNIAVDLLAVDLATITLLFLALFRIMPVVTRLSEMRQGNARVDSYLARVDSYVEDAKAAREIEVGKRSIAGVNTAIVYDDVNFAYQTSERLVLAGVNLSIPVGKFTAITGPSGAGKSTLIDLLPRLLVPKAGMIKIDNTSIADYSLESLRAAFHYVGQIPLLMNGSVADNVRYARPAATHDEVVSACKMAYADEFIRLLPNGYETEIGEGGSHLSGGQKQRLTVARAFLSRAKVIILDEPTSSLDRESEMMVNAALHSLVERHGATIIVIAHKASTVRNADFVAIIDEGRVVASGAPSELIKSQYANFLGDEPQSLGAFSNVIEPSSAR